MATSRSEQINNLRNRAILSALEDALKLADPDCSDVRVWPFNTETEERGRRSEIASYVLSYIVDPLLDALRQSDLGSYSTVHAPRAQAIIELLDSNN